MEKPRKGIEHVSVTGVHKRVPNKNIPPCKCAQIRDHGCPCTKVELSDPDDWEKQIYDWDRIRMVLVRFPCSASMMTEIYSRLPSTVLFLHFDNSPRHRNILFKKIPAHPLVELRIDGEVIEANSGIFTKLDFCVKKK